MKRKLAALAVALSMVCSLTACGGNTTAINDSGSSESTDGAGTVEDTGETAEDTTASEGSGSTEGITISLMTMNTREEAETNGYQYAFWKAVDEWKEAHPDVTVLEETMDQTSYQTKINAVASSGDMPDIFALKGSWTNSFVQNEWVADITDDVADVQGIYVDNAFKFATVEDRIYGVPKQSQCTGLIYYNTELWSEIGYDEFPATWDELLDAVEKFKEKGITAFVMGNKANWPAESCWLSTLGSRFTGDEWTYSIVDGSGAKFTDESFVKALECFRDLAKRGAFNADINSLDDTEQNTVYFNKKAAAIANGDWFISTINNSAPEDVKASTKLALLPAVNGGSDDQTTISGGCIWFWAMSSNEMSSEKRALTIDLLKYVTSQQVGNDTAEHGDSPAVKNPEYDTTKTSDLFNEYQELVKKAKYVPVYDGCMDASVCETMNTGLQSLLIDQTTPEDLASAIQLEQDQVVN